MAVEYFMSFGPGKSGSNEKNGRAGSGAGTRGSGDGT